MAQFNTPLCLAVAAWVENNLPDRWSFYNVFVSAWWRFCNAHIDIMRISRTLLRRHYTRQQNTGKGGEAKGGWHKQTRLATGPAHHWWRSTAKKK